MRWVCVVVGPTGLAVAAAVLWTATNELLIQPTEYTCFNLALEKIKCCPSPLPTLRLTSSDTSACFPNDA